MNVEYGHLGMVILRATHFGAHRALGSINEVMRTGDDLDPSLTKVHAMFGLRM